ncbi:uncharacterized protein LOC142357444 [Convolutriloba macropyga]|uniref:uncharacterized protein LOC142357444 n=1 Tax=Convolutriloba macropyga TaxID=536237 RepID=UPI003F522F98
MGQQEKDTKVGAATIIRQLDVEISDCNLEYSDDPVFHLERPHLDSLVCYKADNDKCHAPGDGGAPTYLFDKESESAICVYSISMWYDSDSEGCTPGVVSVHAKLPFFAGEENFGLDRGNCPVQKLKLYQMTNWKCTAR